MEDEALIRIYAAGVTHEQWADAGNARIIREVLYERCAEGKSTQVGIDDTGESSDGGIITTRWFAVIESGWQFSVRFHRNFRIERADISDAVSGLRKSLDEGGYFVIPDALTHL